MTRTQELMDLMKKLGFDKLAKDTEKINEKWKKEGFEEY